jgi:hypothetical protein
VRTAVTWIGRIVALFAAFAILAPVVLYLFGLTLLPSDRKPDDPSTVPSMARELLWRELGGEGPPAMPSLSPITDLSRESAAGRSLAIAAGRALFKQGKTPRPRMPALFSASLWASSNWSTEQALTTILVRSCLSWWLSPDPRLDTIRGARPRRAALGQPRSLDLKPRNRPHDFAVLPKVHARRPVAQQGVANDDRQRASTTPWYRLAAN